TYCVVEAPTMAASFDQLVILFLGLVAFFVGVSVGDLLDHGLINGQDDHLVDLYIKAHLDRVEHDEELETDFRGVDRTKAPREHRFQPPPEMLPPPGERLEEAKQLMEEMGVDSNVKPGTEDGEV